MQIFLKIFGVYQNFLLPLQGEGNWFTECLTDYSLVKQKIWKT